MNKADIIKLQERFEKFHEYELKQINITWMDADLILNDYEILDSSTVIGKINSEKYEFNLDDKSDSDNLVKKCLMIALRYKDCLIHIEGSCPNWLKENREDLYKLGITVDETSVAIIGQESNSEHSPAKAILFLTVEESNYLIENRMVNSINWDLFSGIYVLSNEDILIGKEDESKDITSKLIEELKNNEIYSIYFYSKYNNSYILESAREFIRKHQSRINKLKGHDENTDTSINIMDLPCVKNFLRELDYSVIDYGKNSRKKPIKVNHDFDIKLRLLEELYKCKYDIFIIPSQAHMIEGSNKSKIDRLYEVLAMIHLCSDKVFVANEDEDAIQKIIETAEIYNTQKWETLKNRLIRNLKFKREKITLKNGKSCTPVPIFLTTYKNSTWLGVLEDFMERTIIKYVDWDRLKSSIKYTEVPENNGTRYTMKYMPGLFVYDKEVKVEEVHISDINIKDLIDLDEVGSVNSIERLFNGESVEWDYRIDYETLNPNKKSKELDSYNKYCFWDAVCRTMEQVISFYDVKMGTSNHPYDRYITVRDLVFMNINGKLKLGYCKPELICSVLYKSDDFKFRREAINSEELGYCDLKLINNYIEVTTKLANDLIMEDVIDNLEDFSDDTRLPRCVLPLSNSYNVGIGGIRGNKKILQALYYSCKSGEGYASRRPLCPDNETTAWEHSEETGVMECFSFEMADWFNVDLDNYELSKVINPYGARNVQSPINIFGGLVTSLPRNREYYVYTPTAIRETFMLVSLKQLAKYPE